MISILIVAAFAIQDAKQAEKPVEHKVAWRLAWKAQAGKLDERPKLTELIDKRELPAEKEDPSKKGRFTRELLAGGSLPEIVADAKAWSSMVESLKKAGLAADEVKSLEAAKPDFSKESALCLCLKSKSEIGSFSSSTVKEIIEAPDGVQVRISTDTVNGGAYIQRPSVVTSTLEVIKLPRSDKKLRIVETRTVINAP